ncbi:MAG: GntR family transcriptional regulator [Synergistetes bacterium]|nr:GntR family transcriptional regulator [Synergistota bacterium]
MPKVNSEDKVYETLLSEIIEHRFKPGDRLLEVEIAKRLGISRTPVRVALKRLEYYGLVEKLQKGGYIIPIPTPDKIYEAFLARELLEQQSAFLAAKSASEDDVAFLKDLHEREKDIYYANDKEAYTKVNEKLHLGIAKMSRNTYIEQFVRQIFWRTQLYVFFFDRFYTYNSEYGERYLHPYEKSSLKDHEEIISAIAKHKPEIAGRRMREHVHLTYELLFSHWQEMRNM